MPNTTDVARNHVTVHQVVVSAPAWRVYDAISDVARWPYIFGPTLHVERYPMDDSRERLRLWAFANGEVRNWTSVRSLDPYRGRISFRQEVSSPPVAHMSGEWVVESLDDTRTKVVLHHTFGTIGDQPEDLEWVERAVNDNSEAELAALASWAELGDRLPDLLLSFSDSVTVDSLAQPVYDFLHRAQDWPDRLPHVSRLSLREPTQNIQSMEMDTRAPDGSTHTTRSVRVCFPPHSIVYKQTTPPPLMAAHVGRWTVRANGFGVVATAAHTVLIRPDKVAAVLGADATIGRARELIREALGRNSLTTLQHAKQAAEGIRLS
jgi:aromatase